MRKIVESKKIERDRKQIEIDQGLFAAYEEIHEVQPDYKVYLVKRYVKITEYRTPGFWSDVVERQAYSIRLFFIAWAC